MTLTQMRQIMKLLLYFAALLVTVRASSRQVRDVHPAFTCESRGIIHHTNQTIDNKSENGVGKKVIFRSDLYHHQTKGHVPNVKLTCPRIAVMDTRTELTCNVMSSTLATIKWFYNGQAITKRHVTVDIRSCNQTLKIKYAKTTDGGNYTCQVTNIQGSVTKTCLLEVKADTSKKVRIDYLKIAGGRKKAFLHGNVNLTCNMLNAHVAIWKKNGSSVTNERHVKKEKRTFGGQGRLFYLEIINVTKSDEGLYTCIGHKNGITVNKTLYLETEPCPPGYYCPHDGNTAFPCPSETHVSGSVPRAELEDCYSTYQAEKPRVASVKNRGLANRNPEYILSLICTFLVIFKS